MRRRFVLLVENETVAGQAAFLKWVKSRRLGHWHWFTNSWLLVTSEDVSVRDVRVKAAECYGNCVVIEVPLEGSTWAGRGTLRRGRNMFDWMRSTWSGKKAKSTPAATGSASAPSLARSSSLEKE